MVRVVDVDARARRRAQSRSDLEDLVVGLLWALFGWRVELLGLVVLVIAQRLLAHAVGDVAALAIVLGLVGAALACRPVRARVGRLGHAMGVRRAWADAAIDAGVAPGRFGALLSCPLIVSPPVIGCGFVCGGAYRCPSSRRAESSLQRACARARSA